MLINYYKGKKEIKIVEMGKIRRFAKKKGFDSN
jgi:hypothetical protein